MELKYLVLLFGLNFLLLLSVSCVLLKVLIKDKVADQTRTIKDFKEQEKKMQEVLDEISNIATMLYGDIESKQFELKSLIREANEKIVLLSNASEGNSDVKAFAEKNKRIEELKQPRIRRHVMPHTDDVHKRIYSLSDDGYNIVDISRMVNKTCGEVELILNLRKVSQTNYEEAAV